MMQLGMQPGGLIPEETRQAMRGQILGAIHNAVLTSGRSSEEAQRYANNIEATAWKQCASNYVRTHLPACAAPTPANHAAPPWAVPYVHAVVLLLLALSA
jgi:hypothetical protein